MTREEAIKELKEDKMLYETDVCHAGDGTPDGRLLEALDMAIEALSAEAEWIPCSERLPSDDEIVNITWVNHNPPPYYADIAEKPFVASGLRYCDKWYWYSSVCQDLHQDFDLIDKDIEVVAWMPLPTPYKGASDDKGRSNTHY